MKQRTSCEICGLRSCRLGSTTLLRLQLRLDGLRACKDTKAEAAGGVDELWGDFGGAGLVCTACLSRRPMARRDAKA